MQTLADVQGESINGPSIVSSGAAGYRPLVSSLARRLAPAHIRDEAATIGMLAVVTTLAKNPAAAPRDVQRAVRREIGAFLERVSGAAHDAELEARIEAAWRALPESDRKIAAGRPSRRRAELVAQVAATVRAGGAS